MFDRGMKNTVSAIDTIFACLFLGLLRLATGISDRPMWEKLRWAIPPGVFVPLGPGLEIERLWFGGRNPFAVKIVKLILLFVIPLFLI